MVRKKTSSELEQAEIKLQSLMEKRDALNGEAQQARQERDLVHEKKREVGVRLRPLKDRRASFAAEARAHREKRDELQAKAKALIELKRKLRASGPTDVGAELRALTRRVSQLEMRQQTASLSLSKENELIGELKESMKRLKVLQSLKADQDKIVKEVRDLDSGITDLFHAAEEQHEAALAMSAKARAAHEETMGLSREIAALDLEGNEKHEAYLAARAKADEIHGKVVELRVPYPMGFFAKGIDGRIDDPTAGWKGKGLWVTSGNRTPMHIEGIDAPSAGAPGKTLASPLVVRFQLRPDPLAR